MFPEVKFPEFLKKGDKIAVVATARKVTHEEIQPGIEILEEQGFEVVIGKSIGIAENQLAGSDSFRREDLQHFLNHPDIQAIWCARGGYGTVKIIDQLDLSEFLKNPKWLIGYSDVTVLHNTLHNLGLASLHAPLVFDIHQQPKNIQNTIFDSLTGKKIRIETEPSPYNRKGKTEGILTGGNLSILYSLMGSQSAVNTAGKILFIEDIDEYLYHLDRMMIGLKRSGIFQNLAGLMVGGMSNMKDNTQEFGYKTHNPYGKTSEAIIFDTVKEYHFPVLFNVPAGHLPENNPLILGEKISLQITESGGVVS